MKLINRVLKETTCEGKTLDIYIEPANDTDMNEWKKKGIYQYLKMRTAFNCKFSVTFLNYLQFRQIYDKI